MNPKINKAILRKWRLSYANSTFNDQVTKEMYPWHRKGYELWNRWDVMATSRYQAGIWEREIEMARTGFEAIYDDDPYKPHDNLTTGQQLLGYGPHLRRMRQAGEKIPAKKIMNTYYGDEYNRTGYAYKATMEFYYGRAGFVHADHYLRQYQNLLENEPYTPYLDSFNVTGLIDWYYHPRMMNESAKENAGASFTMDIAGTEIEYFRKSRIFQPYDGEAITPQNFAFELYSQAIYDTYYGENKLSAKGLKPKHFAYYYRHFDRLDREYGKIFDLKTGRMYPEAKEKFWPDAIDNIGITNPDYVNPRLKPENWRVEIPEKNFRGQDAYSFRRYEPNARKVGMCGVTNQLIPYSCS